MTKMEYAKEVVREIERTTVYTAEAKETVKNNNVVLTGIQINDGTGISPVYYIDDAYNEYMPIEEAAKGILSQKRKNSGSFDLDMLSSFEATKNNILPRLISQVNDVSKMPHMPFLDMYIIYAVHLSPEASVKITNQIMEKWGVTVEDIDAVSRQNIRPEMKTMAETLEEMGFPMPFDEVPMLVITNESKMFGASSILTSEIINRFDQDMYIIPSSVHEMIAVPAKDDEALMLGNIIKEVNRTEVKPEEILGDEPYFFDFKTKEMRRVA